MRLARFSLNDSPRYAFVQKDETDGKDYLIELDGHPLAGDQVKPTGTRYPVDGDGIRLLSPVIPSKVYGLAKNYEAHAQFMHEAGHSEIAHAPEDMVIFTKPSTSVIGPDDPIVYPACSKDMNFEPEVAVVMGRIAKNVTVENAMDYVLGFTCVNDVTLRDLQGIDPTWTREYAHLPLIDNAAGRRLAKRERSLDMGALRARNVTPEQIIGYCAWLLRLQPTPIPCKPADLLADFSWEPLRANHLDRALKPDDPTTPQWLAEALG